MKKHYSLILSLFCLLLLVSCKKSIVEEQIPSSSLSFSCKIDGKLVELKSPSVVVDSYGGSLQRLFKFKNNLKDSALVGYNYGFRNDTIFVTVGFSKIVLIDTTYQLFNATGQSFKEQIYATGSYVSQYVPPLTKVNEIAAQNEGFYIQIVYTDKRKSYNSFLNMITDYSQTKYNAFKSKNTCQITKSTRLETGTYVGSYNSWFIESTFNCIVYQNSIETNNSLNITEGHLSGVF